MMKKCEEKNLCLDGHVHIVFTISHKYTGFLRIFILIFTCFSETLGFLKSMKLFVLGRLLTIKDTKPIRICICAVRFVFFSECFVLRQKKKNQKDQRKKK